MLLGLVLRLLGLNSLIVRQHVGCDATAQRLNDGLGQIVLLAKLLSKLQRIRILLSHDVREVSTSKVNLDNQRLRLFDRQIFQIEIVEKRATVFQTVID